MEIGSEFWLEELKSTENKNNIRNTTKQKFVMSGRTAIDYVLENIEKHREIKRVYFPSYCCESMLQPFIERNVHIQYYGVNYQGQLKYDINPNYQCDIFFAMTYFGFEDKEMKKYKKIFKQKCIVLEDITHSLYVKEKKEEFDYAIASLRKWFPIITGGVAISSEQKFELPISSKNVQSKVIELRKAAMKEKALYIYGKKVNKQGFLEKYKQSNQMLSQNYKSYSMDELSKKILKNLDDKHIYERRRKNAQIIYKELAQTGVEFLFPKLGENDCPLFVPILFEDKEQRNTVREMLIQNNIFCPFHWPKPEHIEKQSNIYDRELSLICDQRYNEKQIYDYVQQLKNIMKEYKNASTGYLF